MERSPAKQPAVILNEGREFAAKLQRHRGRLYADGYPATVLPAPRPQYCRLTP